ncbi:MAG TPA: hypothetical protein VLI04_09360 [Nocardioidaceae bacterium]|nr:hypothetical protein [Nocardioidaceae bacterium]
MTGNRRRQRVLVLFALVALLVASTITTGGRDEPAHAAGACGPNDAYRSTLQLYGGAGTLRPCLSKVNINVGIPQSGQSHFFDIQKIRIIEDNVTLRYADGSTESNLKHITFESFNVRDNMTLTVDGPGYDVRMAPDAAAVIGGEGVNTDLWVTGDSFVTVSSIILFFGLCTTASVNLFSNLSWLLNGSSWTGCGMNLDVRFMAVYRPTGSTTGLFPIKLPNTTISVL